MSHADKGSAIAALGREVGSDAIFYSGDDVTDEDAFKALDSGEGDVPVKVGVGATHAAYRVESVADVVEALEQLRELREQGDRRVLSLLRTSARTASAVDPRTTSSERNTYSVREAGMPAISSTRA